MINPAALADDLSAVLNKYGLTVLYSETLEPHPNPHPNAVPAIPDTHPEPPSATPEEGGDTPISDLQRKKNRLAALLNRAR